MIDLIIIYVIMVLFIVWSYKDYLIMLNVAYKKL